MPDDNRVPLFVRVLPDVKDAATEAAYNERVSLARFVELAMQARLRQQREPADGA